MSELWTKTAPTRKGWYWWRDAFENTSLPTPCEVYDRNGILWMQPAGWFKAYRVDVPNDYMDGEWGPRILSPEELQKT